VKGGGGKGKKEAISTEAIAFCFLLPFRSLKNRKGWCLAQERVKHAIVVFPFSFPFLKAFAGEQVLCCRFLLHARVCDSPGMCVCVCVCAVVESLKEGAFEDLTKKGRERREGGGGLEKRRKDCCATHLCFPLGMVFHVPLCLLLLFYILWYSRWLSRKNGM
jgi:hypothetical protein